MIFQFVIFSSSRFATLFMRCATAIAMLFSTSVVAAAEALPRCPWVSGGDWMASSVRGEISAFASRTPGAYQRAIRPLMDQSAQATGSVLRNVVAALAQMLIVADVAKASPLQRAEILTVLGSAYQRSACKEETLRLLALAETHRTDDDHARCRIVINQAAILLQLDRLEEAAGKLAEAAKLLPPPNGRLAIGTRVAFLNNSALLSFRQGRGQEAEGRFRDELSMLASPTVRGAVGDERLIDSWITSLKLNLAALLASDMQRERIGTLLDEAVESTRAEVGDKHEDFATALRARAHQRSDYENKVDLALDDLRQANAILLELNLSDAAANVRLDIAARLSDKGEIDSAREMMEEAVKILDRESVPPNDRATAIGQLANLYVREGKASKAVPLLARTAHIRRQSRGDYSPQVADDFYRLAEALRSTGEREPAREAALGAAYVFKRLLRREAVGCRSGDPMGTRQARDTLHLAVRLELEARGTEAIESAFHLLQVAELDRTGVASQAAMVRKAAVAEMRLRAHQEATLRRCHLEQDLATASKNLGQSAADLVSKALKDAHAQEAASEAALSTADKRLVAVSKDALTMSDLNSLLRDGEVLLSIRTGKRETFVMHAKKERGRGLAAGISIVDDLDERRMMEAVRTVRRQLEAQADKAELQANLGELSRQLLKYVPARFFKNVTQIIVATDGPMEQLPPHLLQLTNGQMLSDLAPVSVLPSIPTLRWLRAGPLAESPRVLVARGDPDLAAQPCDAAKQSDLTAAASCLGRVSSTGVLMQRLGTVFGSTASSVLGRAQATVASVHGQSLAGAGVLLFATHAVKARELPGLDEPAIILSPDPTASGFARSGVLPASEVMRLPLDGTGIVVLGVCNSAAADERPGAEGYTGLARAFLFAGARAVVVSHWHADADATSRLLQTLLVSMAHDPSLTVGEALRRAMDAARERDPHPNFWAPFVVLGDADARLASN